MLLTLIGIAAVLVVAVVVLNHRRTPARWYGDAHVGGVRRGRARRAHASGDAPVWMYAGHDGGSAADCGPDGGAGCDGGGSD